MAFPGVPADFPTLSDASDAASDPAPIPSRHEPSPPLRPAEQGVEVTREGGWLTVSGRWYSLSLAADEKGMNRSPYAVLLGADGNNWTDINLLSSAHRIGVADETYGLDGVTVDEQEDSVLLTVGQRSTAWDRRETRIRCTPETVEVSIAIRGQGDLDDVTVFGGDAVLRSGAAGAFRSAVGFRSVFAPVPTEPVAFVRPSRASATLGVVGDADPGRLHGIFSPPPFAFGLGRRDATGPTDIPGGSWLGLSARDAVENLTFTTLRYEPLDAGFWLRLSYEGHTRVDGEWTSPAFVLRPAADAFDVVAGHRADLVEHGFATAAPVEGPAWWDEPMFCGWGAQCARSASDFRRSIEASASGEPDEVDDDIIVRAAPAYARESAYEEFLGRLEENGIVPGTVVVDDRWQAEYGTATPDLEHWPDLKRWIADRHARGQRVLLWWKAWDPSGLPVEECVTDPTGRAVSVDPANPAYLAHLREIVAGLLSADGLDADGFKVDFTQRAPSGRHLRGTPGPWGAAALHLMLRTLHEAAKETKPDALVVMHAVHPSFGDVGDMVRLNDVLQYDVGHDPAPVAEQVVVRQRIVRAALPGHPIDTDQWPMPNRDEWLAYAKAQSRLGVPALYYAESIDRSGEPILPEHLAIVRDTWDEYRELVAGRRAARS